MHRLTHAQMHCEGAKSLLGDSKEVIADKLENKLVECRLMIELFFSIYYSEVLAVVKLSALDTQNYYSIVYVYVVRLVIMKFSIIKTDIFELLF